MKSITPKVLSGREVDAMGCGSKSSRYQRQDPNSPYYDPTWPKPIKLSTRSVGYLANEIEAWIASRPRIGAKGEGK